MRVTLGLVAHNHERFILSALRGALSQTYGALQVIITDDASSDRTPDLIQQEIERYKGGHQIEFYRNERNRGLSANINRHMELATGELYVIASGDDISYCNRVERIVEMFRRSGPETMSIHSNGRKIDSNGNSLGMFFPKPPTEWQCKSTDDVQTFHGVWVLGAAHAWSRKIFEFFGPLPEVVTYEDWVIPFRAGLIGRIVYIDEVLVDYRLHDSNLWFGNVNFQSGTCNWRANKLRHVTNEIEALECKDRDLIVAYNRLPEKRSMIASLQHSNQKALENARASQELLRGGVPFRRKIKMVVTYCGRDLPVKQKIDWVLTYVLPVLYFRYRQVRSIFAQRRQLRLRSPMGRV